MRVSVEACTRRLDDRFLVTFSLPGGGIGSAVSDEEIPVGKDAIVRDGKASHPHVG